MAVWNFEWLFRICILLCLTAECQRMKARVVQEIRANQEMEREVDAMDIKIGLLVKNRIDLEVGLCGWVCTWVCFFMHVWVWVCITTALASDDDDQGCMDGYMNHRYLPAVVLTPPPSLHPSFFPPFLPPLSSSRLW